jgi:hypothetical protein
MKTQQAKVKRTHVIKENISGLYVREFHHQVHLPNADEQHADFYTAEEAAAIVERLKGWAPNKPADYEIKEGSISNYMRWLGRRSAKVMTPRKRKAQAKRARGRRGATWKWKTNRSANTI